MNKRIVCAALLLGLTLSAQAQIGTRGPIRRRTVALQPYTELSLAAAFNVFYTPSPSAELTLEATEELLELIDVRQDEGRLHIAVRGDIRAMQRFNLFLSGPHLQRIELIGDGDFQTQGRLYAKRLDITCQGAIGLRVEMDVDELVVDWAGTGRWWLDGRATSQEFSLSGATDLDAQSLIGRVTRIRTVGAGNVALGTTDSLRASVAGPVNLSHRGAPVRFQMRRDTNVRQLP